MIFQVYVNKEQELFQIIFHNGDQAVDELMRLTGRPKSWNDDEFN